MQSKMIAGKNKIPKFEENDRLNHQPIRAAHLKDRPFVWSIVRLNHDSMYGAPAIKPPGFIHHHGLWVWRKGRVHACNVNAAAEER